MDQEKLTELFDGQAAGYDKQWDAIAPIRDGLYLVAETALVGVPETAHVLSVGVGTGAELAHLARRFPRWQFTAVDPSGAMVEACRARADAEGFSDRCTFHHGLLDSLPRSSPFDVATALLVSQFMVDRDRRVAFFAGIAERLGPDGVLISADLASGDGESDFDHLVELWMRIMSGPDVAEERIAGARVAYRRDVAVLPRSEVAAIIAAAGFAESTQIYQAGLLHAWSSRVS